MLRFVLRLVAVVVVGLVALLVVFVVGMRSKSPAVQGPVRRVLRDTVNRKQLETAGTEGAWASVIHHVGRQSGTEYRTPIVAVPTGDQFVIALPYGTSPDWLKNVMAAGSATLDHDGSSYAVTQPTVVPTAEVGVFDEKEQRTHRQFRVDQSLLLTRSP